jgi:hypothetical protein
LGANTLRLGARRRQFWKYQFVIAAAVLVILAAWWLAIPTLGNAAIARRRAADMAANNSATARAIALVEEVQQRTGTTPGEKTLAELLREPLPSLRWDGVQGQIQYRRTGENTFQLSYIDPSMFFGDIVTYDSATPQRGWYRIPF